MGGGEDTELVKWYNNKVILGELGLTEHGVKAVSFS